MAKLEEPVIISIIVPCINEAKRLPLLLADLNAWTNHKEVIISDGGSEDLTTLIAELSGANLIKLTEKNRGKQLHKASTISKGEWLLFLHADSRLPSSWAPAVEKILLDPFSREKVWFFNFKVKGLGIGMRLLEAAVFLRSHLLKRPYGDQGLLIYKSLYKKIGGYKPLPIMEDLEFIERIATKAKIKGINVSIYTDGRKWKEEGILSRTIKNARLRIRWRSGENSERLSKSYYPNEKN